MVCKCEEDSAVWGILHNIIIYFGSPARLGPVVRQAYYPYNAVTVSRTATHAVAAVPELKAIDRMEQRIFQAVQPGDEIKYQPGFGNRNLFFEWKNRAAALGKVTRSNGKYYRAFPEAETVN